jgi:hypothetical protein
VTTNRAGGGWLRVWRANDSTCESNGWSSARNPAVVAVDPFGCRRGAELPKKCNNGTRIDVPFEFREVRGDNWVVWGTGALGAFHSQAVCDGIAVFGDDELQGDSPIWAMAAGTGRTCPCDPQFGNSNLSMENLRAAGTQWTCATVPRASTGWSVFFGGSATSVCRGDNNTGDAWFQRGVALQRTLVVGICNPRSNSTEEIKLAAGDLFVRATVGFDKSKSCETSSMLPTTMTIKSLTTKSSATSSSDATTRGATRAVSTTSRLILMSAASVSTDTNASVDVSTAAIVGGLVGAAVLVGIVLAGVVFWWRARSAPSTGPSGSAAPVIHSEYGTLSTVAQSEYDDVGDVRSSSTGRAEFESAR